MKRKLFSFSCCLVMLLTAIFTSCKQEVPEPTPVDVTAPAEVTVLTITNNNGDAIITWKDPTDKDLFGIEISYVKKAVRNNRAAAPLEGNAVVIAPGKQTATITGLENKATYTFTLKTLDTNGNKSAGVNKNFEAAVNEGGVMNVTLTPDVTEPTNQDFAVNIGIATAGKIKTVKWAKGVQIADYFAEQGTAATAGEGNYSFTATESTTYTVFVQDTDGRREVKTIDINNIDKVSPGAVTNFAAEYQPVNKAIKITWNNPSDADLKEIKISDGTNTYTVDNTKNSYDVTGIIEETNGKLYNFTAVAYDNAGNASSEATCKVSVVSGSSPVVLSFNIPKEPKGAAGKNIIATVDGKNFKSPGVTESNFAITCTDTSITEGAVVTIVSDTLLKVTLKVPEKVGNYTVNIAVGDSNINGTFTVEESAVIGDILLNDGKYVSVANLKEEQKAQAVAVVCGVNSQGKLLGLGLKQSETLLQWAPSSSTGYSTKFTDIICTPDKTGSGAADSATFTGDTDGSDNWSVICGKDTAGTATEVVATNYPAFNWVKTYGEKNVSSENYKTGWYMPSIAELTEIYRNRTEVNAALNKLGPDIASPLKDTYYWSSSQGDSPNHYAWQLNFSSGSLYSSYKKYEGNVCCVRAF